TAAGLTFIGESSVTLQEGFRTNLLIQVSSTNSQIVLFDYTPTNLPPAFVSLKSRSFNNTATNGTATAELEFNPLHDAAGQYTFALRAASAAGQSGALEITVTVSENSALLVTRWKDPVNGSFTDS